MHSPFALVHTPRVAHHIPCNMFHSCIPFRSEGFVCGKQPKLLVRAQARPFARRSDPCDMLVLDWPCGPPRWHDMRHEIGSTNIRSTSTRPLHVSRSSGGSRPRVGTHTQRAIPFAFPSDLPSSPTMRCCVSRSAPPRARSCTLARSCPWFVACGLGEADWRWCSQPMASNAHVHADDCCAMDATLDSCCARDRREREQFLAHRHRLEDGDALGWRRKDAARRSGAPSAPPARAQHAPWTSSEDLYRALSSLEPDRRVFVHVCADEEHVVAIEGALARASATWYRCASPLWTGPPSPPALAMAMAGRVVSVKPLSDAPSPWEVARWIARCQSLDPDVLADAMDDGSDDEADGARRSAYVCKHCPRDYPHEHVAVPIRRRWEDEDEGRETSSEDA
eukprot:scaffold584_cov338-Pavlova_lutheri.AAC.36